MTFPSSSVKKNKVSPLGVRTLWVTVCRESVQVSSELSYPFHDPTLMRSWEKWLLIVPEWNHISRLGKVKIERGFSALRLRLPTRGEDFLNNRFHSYSISIIQQRCHLRTTPGFHLHSLLQLEGRPSSSASPQSWLSELYISGPDNLSVIPRSIMTRPARIPQGLTKPMKDNWSHPRTAGWRPPPTTKIQTSSHATLVCSLNKTKLYRFNLKSEGREKVEVGASSPLPVKSSYLYCVRRRFTFPRAKLPTDANLIGKIILSSLYSRTTFSSQRKTILSRRLQREIDSFYLGEEGSSASVPVNFSKQSRVLLSWSNSMDHFLFFRKQREAPTLSI